MTTRGKFTKAETIVLWICCIYAGLSLTFVFLAYVSLLGSGWHPTFFWLSGLSAVSSLGVFVWWLVRARVGAGLVSAGLLAGVAAVFLWAAIASVQASVA